MDLLGIGLSLKKGTEAGEDFHPQYRRPGNWRKRDARGSIFTSLLKVLFFTPVLGVMSLVTYLFLAAGSWLAGGICILVLLMCLIIEWQLGIELRRNYTLAFDRR